MLFQSQVFLLGFLPVTVALWYGLAERTVAREWCLLICSLVFYAWWDVRFVPLLVLQGGLSWLAAEIFQRRGGQPRALLIAAIAANLAVLAFFKYWTFLAQTVLAALGMHLPDYSIILPIGISFFTFEIISYLVDLGWRGAPHYNFRRFGLFVAFFPRLIAGPIVRHNEIIPQFDLAPLREGLAERLSQGATLLVLGLAKKLFLADALAPLADAAFRAGVSETPSLGIAWTGALAFTFQLFLDFSAYSEMAIGIALMLGLTLPANFAAPYQSLDLRDFWQRWHMTLSRYFRDYLYFPLGGSHHGWRTFAVATLATMGLCGLWHGAGWTFIVWGLLHGLGLIVCRAWARFGVQLPHVAAWTLTFVFVVAGWVLFRASGFTAAGHMLAGLIGLGGFSGALEKPALLASAAAVSLLGPTTQAVVAQWLRPVPAIGALVGLLAAAVVLETGKGQPVTFIYFQF